MFALAKKHFAALLIALTLGTITFSLNIWRVDNMGDDFAGIYPMTCCNDEIYYLARAKDVLDGHGNLSNPYLYEYKEGPALQFWLPDYLLASSGKALGTDVWGTYAFYDFWFVTLLALLVYMIGYRLSGNRLLSIAPILLLNTGFYLNLFTRPISPQFNLVFFLLFFYFLVRYLEGFEKKYLIWTTIFTGLLFHVYTYYWTYAFVLIPVMFALFWLLKLQSFKQALRDGAVMIGGALLIGLPYILQMLESVKLPYYAETLARMGMLHTRLPSGLTIVFWASIIGLLFMLLYWRKFIPRNALSVGLFAATISTAIAVNHHIITGQNLEFSNHYIDMSVFIFALSMVYLVGHLIGREGRASQTSAIVIIAGALLMALPTTVNTVERQATPTLREMKMQRYAPVFAWLDQNTEKDSVVYTDNDIARITAIYTHNNIFHGDATLLHFMPSEEILDRFIINNYFNDDLQNWSKDQFIKAERRIWGTGFVNEYQKEASANRYRRLLGLDEYLPDRLPDEVVADALARHTEVQAKSFSEAVGNYRVDYVVWDRLRNPDYKVDQTPELTLLEQIGELYIFKLN